jgi:acetyl esterase/lipase
MRMLQLLVVLFTLSCFGGLARAEDPPVEPATPSTADGEAAKPKTDPLVAAAKAWLDATDDGARAMAAFGLLGNSQADVQAALAKARTYAEASSDVGAAGRAVRWKVEGPGEKDYTAFAAVPAGYDPAKAWPALVYLHGGVAREGDGGGVIGLRLLGGEASERGFILICPSTQRGAEWWTPAGMALIHKALADAKQRWHIDPDRVAATGFSDGASGCYHLLQHDPDPWCCFLPFMGHPGLTGMMGGPAFRANAASRPVFAVHGGQDQLYPSKRMKPLIDQMKSAGANIEWRDLPEATHSPGHVAGVWEEAYTFWTEHPRKPAKRTRFVSTVPTRVDGVEIVRIDATKKGDASLDLGEFPLPPGRPRLGIVIDQEYAGPGLRIESVQDGSPADEAGMLAGDVLIGVDDDELEAPAEAFTILRRHLARLTENEKAKATFRVQREDEELEFETRPKVLAADAPPRPAALGYDQPAGAVVVEVATNNRIVVKARHVGALRLHLGEGTIDWTKPVTVEWNGKVVHEGKASPDVAYYLGEVHREGTPRTRFVGSLLVRP